MANTTWNPSDKSANITLSGSNLIATTSAGATAVRAVDKQITGKFYWENTVTVWVSSATGVGITTAALPLGVAFSAAIGAFNVIKNGLININGAATSSTLGARASGDIIGIAMDLTNQLGWMRVAPSGNWNGSATANPATGVGGISLALIAGGGFPLYPLAAFNTASDSVTANFGDTAFSGAVPSGFTSGFTAGASIAVNAVATQIAAEEWATGTPTLQLTQIAIEEWAAVQTVTPQLAMTQIALEEWASVAVITPSIGAPMITMIGTP